MSAKEGYNVTEAIIEMARETMKKEKKIEGTQSGVKMGLAESHQRHDSRGRCCNN